NGEAQQQANGVKDADEHKAARPSTSPGTHQDHGQGAGGGSAGAPGQGGSGHGNSGDHRPTPSPHTPSPHPSSGQFPLDQGPASPLARALVDDLYILDAGAAALSYCDSAGRLVAVG